MSEGFFTIELGRYGFMLDTEWFYVSFSWHAIITTAVLFIGYKIYKRILNKKINNTVKCNTTNDANVDLWGNNEQTINNTSAIIFNHSDYLSNQMDDRRL